MNNTEQVLDEQHGKIVVTHIKVYQHQLYPNASPSQAGDGSRLGKRGFGLGSIRFRSVRIYFDHV